MTGVLIVLAVLSAIGGFLSIPHYLEPLLPLPEVVPALEHLETPLVFVSVALALVGLVGAAFVFGGNAARARSGLRRRFAGAASSALRQVFRRRGLRPPDRAAAVLDFRSRVPAPRRPQDLSTER